MIRLIGAFLVAGGTGWLGFQAARGLRQQVRSLRQMAEGLALLERELALNAPPLPQLMSMGAAHSEGPAKELFQGCFQGLERLDQEDFSTLWRRLVSQCYRLGPEGQALLLPLGDTLGRYMGGQQLERLATVRCNLEALSHRLEEDSRRQGQVYQALGLSSGAFLVIMLL